MTTLETPSLTVLFWICAGWTILSVCLGLVWALLAYEKPKPTRDEDAERLALLAYLETRRWEAHVQREAAQRHVKGAKP